MRVFRSLYLLYEVPTDFTYQNIYTASRGFLATAWLYVLFIIYVVQYQGTAVRATGVDCGCNL